MRVAVTAVAPTTGRRVDVHIDADQGTMVVEVAVELDRLVYGAQAAATVTGGAQVLQFPRGRTETGHRGLGVPGPGATGFTAMAAGFPAAAAARPPAALGLFVNYQQVPPDIRLADSPIRDGSLVSVGDPAGCRRPEPAVVAELRVSGGPAAGFSASPSFRGG